MNMKHVNCMSLKRITYNFDSVTEYIHACAHTIFVNFDHVSEFCKRIGMVVGVNLNHLSSAFG